MPQPILSQVHIDRAITQAAMRYKNQTFIADQVAPIVPVTKESDYMFIFDKAEWLRDVAANDRRPGSRAPRSGYTLSNVRYQLQEIAIAHGVPDRIVAGADDPLRPIQNGTDFCMQLALLRRERRTRDLFFGATAWGTNTTLTGTDQWSDFVNSDPANDVATAQRTVLQNTGFLPNTMIVGQATHDKLKIHPDGLDRFKYTQNGIMDEAMIAQWLGIQRYIVGRATRNSAAEGAAFTGSFVWDDNAVILYVPAAPSIEEPSAAYIYQKGGVETRSFYEEAEQQTVVEVTIATDPRIVGSDLGYQYRDTNA